ncbi:chorion transcription factor Cf2-like [Penaeus monodon]|uniref:chorion transcription factor Cf2-like n=1 Tax=Penaeus monodon TaxID=6687 RepID=UPI0018A7D1E2|nr:chorion transcription factor Cf2-like [Penaeus monodon]
METRQAAMVLAKFFHPQTGASYLVKNIGQAKIPGLYLPQILHLFSENLANNVKTKYLLLPYQMFLIRIKNKMKPSLQVEWDSNHLWTDVRRPTEGWQGITSSRKLHQCPYCAYNVPNSFKLRRHILKHTGEKPHSCTYCSYSTTRKELLRDHLRLHTGEKPFPCPYCPYTASHKNMLKSHLRKHS